VKTSAYLVGELLGCDALGDDRAISSCVGQMSLR
jgi:hypothetical protein